MNFDSVCPNLTALTRALANLVYKDLSKDERLSNIHPQFESNCGVFYLSAKNVEDQQLAYLPIPHSKDIDFELINALQQKLISCTIIVAIVDNTGNILYYQMTEGFKEK